MVSSIGLQSLRILPASVTTRVAERATPSQRPNRFMHHYSLTLTGVLALMTSGTSLAELKPSASSPAQELTERTAGELNQGLVATFRDGALTISQVVKLPELGLAAEESPHPAIAPHFTVTYKGILMVTAPGRYEFDAEGLLSLDGQKVVGEVALDAGPHALRLNYERPTGAVSVGLSWQSKHFVKEPVPPHVLWHIKSAAPDNSAQEQAGNHPSPSHRIEEAMSRLNCASCHENNFLATMHHKFAPEALLAHMRHANPMKWYGAMTGPLLEEGDELTQLAKDLRKLPQPERRRGETAPDPRKGLAMVGTKTGLACIACHDIKHHRTPAESKGPNLSFITQRVSYDWFVRWMSDPQRMKPGVPMPAFFAIQSPGDQKKSIDALWDYLIQGDKMELPEELVVDPKQFVLKPTSKPMIHRVYVRPPDGRELLRTICVGLPNGVSYCFDAESCQLVYVWTGGYLDMTPHWKNQSLHPIPMVGTAFFLASEEEGLRIGDHAPVFRGYELVGGIPRFEFRYGDTEVRLSIDAPTPDQIQQSYTIGKRPDPIQFIGPPTDSSHSMKSSSGKWDGNCLTLTETGEIEFTLTLSNGE